MRVIRKRVEKYQMSRIVGNGESRLRCLHHRLSGGFRDYQGRAVSLGMSSSSL